MVTEIEWRDVVGYEGLYKVSRCGQVYSVKRRIVDHRGLDRSCGGRILKQLRHNSGYMLVNLRPTLTSGKHYVHRLVVAAFCGPIQKGIEINHLDGVKDNNRLENLETVTPAQNSDHARRMGFLEKKIPRIFHWGIIGLIADGLPLKDVAEAFGVSSPAIRNIVLKHPINFI